MAEIIKSTLTFVLSNFSLTFFVISVAASLIAIARLPRPFPPGAVVEKLLFWHLLVALGATYLYGAVCHLFFGAMTASFIGWPDSPFQFEVGIANLAFAVMAIIAAFASLTARSITIVGSAVFLLGAAAGHIYQMVTTHNFAPGNAGVIFYTDILLPLYGLILLWLKAREPRHPT
jgi:uncharacterized protein DUF6790